MKSLMTLAAVLLVTSFSVFGQEKNQPGAQREEIFTNLTEFPEAPYSVNEYLSKNIEFPADARGKEIQGRVILRFVVNEDGTIGDVRVSQSVYPSIDSEAVRVVRAMPKWKPGRNADREPVKVNFHLPIKFSLKPGSLDHLGDPPISYHAPKKPIKGPIFDYAEVMPDPGLNINSYISSQITAHNIEELIGIKGRVLLRFIVTTEGDLDSFRVIKSLQPIVDTLAINLLDIMPKWKAGTNNGVPVNVSYTLPVPFNFVADTSTRQETEQPVIEEKPLIYTMTDVAPQPLYRMSKYLSGAIQYPEDASRLGKQGVVVVRFIVDEEGHISSPTVVKSVFPSLDAEAIRVVTWMPSFKPGMVNGKPVKTYSSLSIDFHF